jgi:hypothetical protein
MLSSSGEEIEQAFERSMLDVDRVCELSFEALTTPELLRMLERLEKVARRLPVPGHGLINQLVQQATPAELGGKLSHALADRLRISRGEAGRRVAEAADLGPRRALTGEPLVPRLPATAAAQRDGKAGASHAAVIRRFLDELPRHVTASRLVDPAGPGHAGGGVGEVGRPRHVQPRRPTPTVDGPPSEEAVQRDTRSSAQRNHDALNAEK